MKLLAAVALLGLAFFVVSAGGASAAEPEPPEVRSGTAQSNCQRIVDAGFSTDDYVLSSGRWQHRPDWSGADGARMSRIWRSVAICRGEYSFLPAPTRQPSRTVTLQPDSRTPLGANQGGPVRQTASQQIIIEDPEEVVERREQERERQPAHKGIASCQACGHPELGRVNYEQGGRADPKKTTNYRVTLSAQEWYKKFNTEHPFGGSYGGDKNPDPNFGCDNVYGPGFSDTRCGRD